MDRKKKAVGIVVILLVALSSIVYAENQKDEKTSNCPCEKEVRGGYVPDESQVVPTAYHKTECKWVDEYCWQLPHHDRWLCHTCEYCRDCIKGPGTEWNCGPWYKTGRCTTG